MQKKKTGKHITEKQAIRICRISENLSSLVQHLAWLIWYKASPDVSDQMIDQAIDELLNQNRLFYQRDMETMTAYQKKIPHCCLNMECNLLISRDIACGKSA